MFNKWTDTLLGLLAPPFPAVALLGGVLLFGMVHDLAMKTPHAKFTASPCSTQVSFRVSRDLTFSLDGLKQLGAPYQYQPRLCLCAEHMPFANTD